MTIFLFAFYFFLLLLIISRVIKKTEPEIKFGTITAMFSFKVLMGCAYGYIFLLNYGGDDTWVFFRDSLPEYQKLIHHPWQFLNDFSPADEFNHASNFFQFIKEYLYDFEYWMMRKLLALFNVFSQGNYYIDALFFDFVIFWGPFLLLKSLLSYFPSKRNILILIIFFFPSVSFWLSGIRAEGLVFLFMAISIHYSAKWFNHHKISSLILTMIGILGMLAFRGVYLLVFIPAFISWILTFIYKRKPVFVFFLVYILSASLFFGSSLLSERNNLPSSIVSRQQDFFHLPGKTIFRLDTLESSPKSFIKILPQAFSNTFFRPFIWESKGFLQIISALDIFVFWVLILLLLIFHENDWRTYLSNPLLLLFSFYGITLTLLIGYIVPFPGAIVRYKSIAELLILCAITIAIDYKKLFKL